jgi:serine/threonine-protein kinase
MRFNRRGERGRRAGRAALLLGAAAAVATLVCLAYAGNVGRPLELTTVDARFSIRGTQTPPSNLVIVQIDDATIAALGRWPFSRSYHAEAIQRISRDRPLVIAYDVQFSEKGPSPRADRALLTAVRRAGRIVLATTDPAIGGFLHSFTPPAEVGNTGLPDDPGAVIRRMGYSVGGLKSFALTAAEVAGGRRISASSLGGDTAWIDFYGPPGTIPTVSFARVVAGDVKPGFFTGKIVVVGAVAPSLQDLHTTSVSGDGQMAGPEIVASAISTALRGFPLRTAPRMVNFALIVLLALLIPLANLRLPIGLAVGAGAAVGLLYLGSAQLAFDAGWIVPVVYPLSGLALSAVAVTACGYSLVVLEAHRLPLEQNGELGTGAVLAGYRIERKLGRGGGGTVYLATELELRRKVAVKVLNPELTDDSDFRKRFLHESRLAAALAHPHVVAIYRAGEVDGHLFVAMQWVRGSLADLISRDGRLDLRRAVAVVEQAAEALDAAHQLGLVHRDVTPSNILLDPPRTSDAVDRVYLADFGLTLHHGLTSSTGRVGKPDYVAPEQIRGDAVDGRADQYSLGCVLFECLVGEPPFPGNSEIVVIGGHLGQPPPRAAALRHDLPAEIDHVLARALAKLPEERYETCSEFAAAVRAALSFG